MVSHGISARLAVQKKSPNNRKQQRWAIGLCAIIALTVSVLLVGCGSGGGSAPPPPVPSILNINSSTTPSSPVGLPIEINGSGFQSAPGKVVFTQGSITASVVPNSSGWTDTGIVVTVPSTLTTPGTVNVTVVTSGGTSNPVTLTLVQ